MGEHQKRSACPCTSGASYRECCRPLHEGAAADDPVRLMRSRFAAFALGDGAYLWRTLHADHPLRQRDEAEVVRELSLARRRLRYLRLTVHDAVEDGDRARVLFTARVFQKGTDRSFTELSDFARDGETWCYAGGVARPPSERATIEAFLDEP